MPWNNQSGQGGDQKPGGPWGQPPRQPWGQGPRGPRRGPGGERPDLEELLRRARERARGLFGGGAGGEGGEGARRGFGGYRALAALAFVVWLASGVYVVDAGEVGVVTRFGAYQGPPRGPGLHYHLPVPFEAARTVSVQSQRREDIPERSRGGDTGESLMITGDRNIVDIGFTVLYRLSSAPDFLFNVREPETMVRAAAESAMREVIGQRQLQAIITTDRAGVEQAVETLMQRIMDEYDSGVQVLQVQLLRAAAPRDVIEAFDDVVRAGSDRQTVINQATQYRNEIVPRARGEAAQQIQQAEAYREQAVREANGEAARFLSVYEQYRAAPQVTRQRLYLEAMERVYRGADKIIIDRAAGVQPYLPLEQLRRSNTPAPPAAPAPAQRQR